VTLGDGVTLSDWVRLVAAEHGVHGLTDGEVDMLLIERTAWPFTSDPTYLRPQLVAALIGPDLCPCCGDAMTLAEKQLYGVCRRCVVHMGWLLPRCPDRW
jgi:hypothetical protein